MKRSEIGQMKRASHGLARFDLAFVSALALEAQLR